MSALACLFISCGASAHLSRTAAHSTYLTRLQPNCSTVKTSCRTHLCDTSKSGHEDACSLCICRSCQACLAGKEAQRYTHPGVFTTAAYNKYAKQAKAALPKPRKRGKGKGKGRERAAAIAAVLANNTVAIAAAKAKERSEFFLQIGTYISHVLVLISLALFIPLGCLCLRGERTAVVEMDANEELPQSPTSPSASQAASPFKQGPGKP